MSKAITNLIGKKGSLRSRTIFGYFWSLAGSILSKGALIGVSYYIARILGQEGFGEYGIYQNTINTLGTLAGVGISSASIKFIAQYRTEYKIKLGKILALNLTTSSALSLIIGISLYFSANYVADKVFKNPHMAEYLTIGAFSIFFSVINGAISGAFAGFEKFRMVSIINFIGSITNATMQFLLVTNYQLQGIALAILISNILVTLISLVNFYKVLKLNKIPLSLSDNKIERRTLLTFNLPSVLGSLMVSPINWLCTVFLVNQSNGYAEMGIYTAANQWRVALLFIPTTIGPVVLSMLSNIQNDENRYRRFFLANIFINAVISIMLISVISISSTWLMEGYGEKFRGNTMVLIVMMVVAGLTSVNNVIGNAIISRGKMWTGFTLNLAWGIELLLSAYYLSPLYGALGLASSHLIAYTLHTLVQFIYVKKHILKKIR